MANYTIIGGDGKEYGPITETDVRLWLTEGRLNGQSLAKAESDAEFRPLEKFPEFASSFEKQVSSVQTPPTLTTSHSNLSSDSARNLALEKIKAPAVALKVTAILNILLSLWNVVKLLFFRPNMEALSAAYPQMNDPMIQKWMAMFYGPLGIGTNVFALVIAVLVLVGASKMQSLSNYSFAFIAAVLAMVPCMTSCCIIGLPFGIWALVIMHKPEVKSQFK